MLLRPSNNEPQLLLGYTPDLPLNSLDRVYQSMWALYPTWSPDGQSLAFVSQYGPPYGSPASDYRLGLFGMPAERGAERIMYYTDQNGHVGRLAYAPDGSGIFFALAPDAPGIARIYRYDMASGEAGEVPGIPEQSYDPAISPDGRLLAFAARHGAETDIFVLRLDQQSAPIQITHHGAARAPAFSPDGKQLAFLAASGSARSFDLWILDLHSTAAAMSAGEPERISFDMGIDADSGISWGPQSVKRNP
jgi:TolB protein